MMERKLFYNELLMYNDKMKILLGVHSPTGIIHNYQEHLTALHHKLCELILQAWDEGEDVPDMIESYLGEPIYRSGFREMAWDILELPQMKLILLYLLAGWNALETVKDSSPAEVQKIKQIYKLEPMETDEEGLTRTEELFEELTLRLFLEQLSMSGEDLI